MWVAAYLWVALWTGILLLGAYKPDEPTWHKIVGPISIGLLWPVSLPLVVLGTHPPKDYGLS